MEKDSISEELSTLSHVVVIDAVFPQGKEFINRSIHFFGILKAFS